MFDLDGHGHASVHPGLVASPLYNNTCTYSGVLRTHDIPPVIT